MRWIKASDRIPENAGRYFIRYIGKNGQPQKTGSFFNGFRFPSHKNVEWLEEEVPLPAVEEGSQDEVRDKLRRDLKEKFGFETGTVRRITAYLFNNYKITKI